MRVLERAIQGGLGAGNLGVLMSRHGTGKVAVLTSIALDHAMDGRATLHVAVGKSVSDIRAYHDEVYQELVQSLARTDMPDLLTVERHKQIYTYQDGAFAVDRLRETLSFLAGHAQFVPELIELQGWPDFDAGVPMNELSELKKLAKEFSTEIWLTAQTHREDPTDDSGTPPNVAGALDLIDVLIALDEEADHVNLRFVKTHDEPPSTNLHLEFDPKTMLVRWR